MEFISLVDQTVATTAGHAIEFKAKTPTYVPPGARKEVRAAGIVPVNEVPEDVPAAKPEPEDPDERSGLIQLAIQSVVERARRTDFTSGGSPHAKILSEEVGFPIEAKERDAEWAKFQAEKTGG